MQPFALRVTSVRASFHQPRAFVCATLPAGNPFNRSRVMRVLVRLVRVFS